MQGSVLECHLESDLDQLIYSYHPKLHVITSEWLLSNNSTYNLNLHTKASSRFSSRVLAFKV